MTAQHVCLLSQKIKVKREDIPILWFPSFVCSFTVNPYFLIWNCRNVCSENTVRNRFLCSHWGLLGLKFNDPVAQRLLPLFVYCLAINLVNTFQFIQEVLLLKAYADTLYGNE